MSKINKKSVHLGHKKTFNGWKLIWHDVDGKVFLAPITEKVAKVLLAKGFACEG